MSKIDELNNVVIDLMNGLGEEPTQEELIEFATQNHPYYLTLEEVEVIEAAKKRLEDAL